MNKIMFLFFIAFFVLIWTLDSHAFDAKQELKNLELEQDKVLEQNWGLKKIEVEKSWNISQGSKNIIVAIIDTGMDMNHPALKNNLWVNVKEIPNNGVDDDGNGFIDDLHGWNFVNNTNQPFDSHGHGTHITGIIHNVAPKVSFMILKYFDPKSLSDKNLSNTVRAIDYAVEMGAHIINYSGGGFGSNPKEKEAIQRAKEKNVLFVAAAGNDSTNSDKDSFYPASYDLSNIISVASITEDSQLVESSNYGVKTIDIAAPGNAIYSTLPNGRYGKMTGTSQATAFVTGVLAILMDVQPDIKTSEKFIEYLIKTGDLEESLNGKTKYKTKLNSYRTLSMKGREINASGIATENTKLINNDIFSSESSIVNNNLNLIIQDIKHKNRIRIPAQQ